VQGERRKAKGESKISAERRSFVFMKGIIKYLKPDNFPGLDLGEAS
jgi:hypothetical protein